MLKLIFIYNANSGVAAATMDTLHKVFSPKTYKCQLSKVTHGLTGMKGEWKAFLRNLPYESAFYHIDEFEAEFPDQSIRYPSLAVHENDTLVELISPAQLKQATNLDEMMALISKSLPKEEIDFSDDSSQYD